MRKSSLQDGPGTALSYANYSCCLVGNTVLIADALALDTLTRLLTSTVSPVPKAVVCFHKLNCQCFLKRRALTVFCSLKY